MLHASAEARRELGVEPVDSRDRLFLEFASRCAPRCDAVHAVCGDGNCMFRALADQMWRDADRHAEVRRLVADEMARRPTLYASEHFVPDPDDGLPPGARFEDYVRACVARPGFWADERCLQAFCNATGAGASVVWQSTVTKRHEFSPDVRAAAAASDAHAWLFWQRDRHYDSLRLEEPWRGG